MIMQALSVAAVKISCWVIVESFVSRYEDHFYLKRNMNEESVNEEFEIAVNGPNLANSDSVFKWTGIGREAAGIFINHSDWENGTRWLNSLEENAEYSK